MPGIGHCTAASNSSLIWPLGISSVTYELTDLASGLLFEVLPSFSKLTLVRCCGKSGLLRVSVAFMASGISELLKKLPDWLNSVIRFRLISLLSGATDVVFEILWSFTIHALIVVVVAVRKTAPSCTQPSLKKKKCRWIYYRKHFRGPAEYLQLETALDSPHISH